MAKRKKRKTAKKNKIEVGIELYAVLLVIIAILGIGKMGPVGELIASFSLFATGSIYMVLLKENGQNSSQQRCLVYTYSQLEY